MKIMFEGKEYKLLGVRWSNEVIANGLYMGEVVGEYEDVEFEGHKYLDDDGTYVYVDDEEYENETKDAHAVVVFKKLESRAS